jgi:hypothetical protein
MSAEVIGVKEMKLKTCFVVGPIGSEGTDTRMHADWLLDGIIRPAMVKFSEFSAPVRADTISSPGLIDTQIIEHLLTADLVIADLSFLNPNAFYELGIRHVIEKPIIHMQLKAESLPFDVGGFRTIKFSLRHPIDIAAAIINLTKAVTEAVDSNHRVETPVSHARGRMKIEENASPGDRVLFDEIQALRARMNQLEQRGPSPSAGQQSEDVNLHRGNGIFILAFDPAKTSQSDVISRAIEIGQEIFPERAWTSFNSNEPNSVAISSNTEASDADFRRVAVLYKKIPGVTNVE